MNLNPLPLLGLLLVAAGCASTSARSFAGPEEAAVEILAALDEGRWTEADRIYGAYTRDADREQLLYPVLFEAARGRFETGQPRDAAAVLELLVERHPTALGSREALVYALFLERAEQSTPDAELIARFDAALANLRASSPRLEPWVDLAETQLRIDQDRLDEARDAFERFLVRWTGEPAKLMPYAEDLNRYLQSH